MYSSHVRPASSGRVIASSLRAERLVVVLRVTIQQTRTDACLIVFMVPQTHDMVSQLLSPSQPKNLSDLLVLVTLALHILVLILLPSTLRIPVFAAVFLLWRAGYNVGIGYLLHAQSRHRRLVAWAKKSRIFIDPLTGSNPHPTLYNILKREMETKIPKDYEFDKAPIEYNTWLVFRRLVDLILMCDFVSYCLFAMACAGRPIGEGVALTSLRWTTGLSLFGLNLWVKLDAHRVVKDYAWYWGDFFFLIDQELTFDGVFEMAPHPMYSVGYAGYYGISLMAASYKVLFISIVAHAAQFAFLVWVENPHIEKTYNSPPPRRQLLESDFGLDQSCASKIEAHFNESPPETTEQHLAIHKLISIDLHRATDTAVILLQICLAALVLVTPSDSLNQAIFTIHAALWRLWYSMGIGFILNRQSTRKRWTRHFLKYGDSTEEAWRQWKGTYHLSLTMCYASFIAACWKAYSFPKDWSSGFMLLRHVVGMGLISLQMWTAVSIYESLGEFGWFYGDFFFDHSPKLTYSGIYRYLNNPERVIGLAGVWGAVLIINRTSIFLLALLSHVLTLIFIQFVERPHMQKLYGQSLRRESGLVRSLKRSLPPPLQEWQGIIDRILAETLDLVEEFVDAARPKITAGVNLFVKDSMALLTRRTRIHITLLASDLSGVDPRDYALKIQGTSSTSMNPVQFQGSTDPAETGLAQQTERETLVFEYGTPIKLQWLAPLNHSKKDWVGLYRVADNSSREVTRVASQGRWLATNRDQYDSIISDHGILSTDEFISPEGYFIGEMEFTGDKLWWTCGVFEFRYHHDGKHNVMAISRPFEIQIRKFGEDVFWEDSRDLIRGVVEDALLHLVRNCLDRDPNIVPRDKHESFGSLMGGNRKYEKRIAYAVHQM